MRQKDIDSLVNAFVAEERALPVNPFLATRIIGKISKGSLEQKRLIPAWQRVAMAVSFVLVTGLGIKAGSMYKQAEDHSNATTVVIASDDTMEHFEFYRETSKE